jgi:hypothetical protein
MLHHATPRHLPVKNPAVTRPAKVFPQTGDNVYEVRGSKHKPRFLSLLSSSRVWNMPLALLWSSDFLLHHP